MSLYNSLEIYNYRYWTLFLHQNQCYLGRCYFLCNDPEKKDFLDMNSLEAKEIFTISRSLKGALEILFHPDKFNYSALGNVYPRLHIHIIPRYKSERIFESIPFLDERWGQNYAPYNKSFHTPSEILQEIKRKIKNLLS